MKTKFILKQQKVVQVNIQLLVLAFIAALKTFKQVRVELGCPVMLVAEARHNALIFVNLLLLQLTLYLLDAIVFVQSLDLRVFLQSNPFVTKLNRLERRLYQMLSYCLIYSDIRTESHL